MSQCKFSIIFLSRYETQNLVCMLLLMFEFSPSIFGLDVGHVLQLFKILSIFIKRSVPRSFSSNAYFLGKDLIISIFVYSRVDGLNLYSILNLPSMLNCLPPFVRKFWSPPLVAWKNMSKLLVKSFLAMGRWEDPFMLFNLIKLFALVVLVFVSLVLLIPIMIMLFLLTLISFQDPT